MRRWADGTLVVLLAALASAQIAVSFRRASQLAPPPPLYAPPATSGAALEAGASADSVTEGSDASGGQSFPATDEVVRPDPANILRVTLRAEGPRPRRMEAEAGYGLVLHLTNNGPTSRTLEIVDASGTVAARSKPLASGQEQPLSMLLKPGEYRVRAAGSRSEAVLTVR